VDITFHVELIELRLNLKPERVLVGNSMTKLIRNLSFATFLAAASFSSSPALHADDCDVLWYYCVWGPGESGTNWGCTGLTCNFMAGCAVEICQEDGKQLTSFSCHSEPYYIWGNLTCS
jgi:hypothetical protein